MSIFKELAEQFCCTPLPDSVCTDPCASITDYPIRRYGTNLMSVDEAAEMFEKIFSTDPRFRSYIEMYDKIINTLAIAASEFRLSLQYLPKHSVVGVTKAADECLNLINQIRESVDTSKNSNPTPHSTVTYTEQFSPDMETWTDVAVHRPSDVNVAASSPVFNSDTPTCTASVSLGAEKVVVPNQEDHNTLIDMLSELLSGHAENPMAPHRAVKVIASYRTKKVTEARAASDEDHHEFRKRVSDAMRAIQHGHFVTAESLMLSDGSTVKFSDFIIEE